MNRFSSIRFGMLGASIVVLLLSISLYAYLYHDTLVLADHAITAQNAAADSANRTLQSKDTLNLASSTSVARSELSNFFVQSNNAVAFITSMEAVGKLSKANVSISSLSETQGSDNKNGNIGSVTAQITMSGSWINVMNAIELFETLPYKTNIDNLKLNTSIDAGDRTSASHTWNVSFNISAPTI